MATIFQTKEWENFKLATGYSKNWRVFDILVLEKKIPLLGSMLYSPMMSRDQTKLAMQKIFLDQIKKIAADEKALFYRMESVEEADGDIDPAKSGYEKAFEEMQPEHTLLIYLTKSEEDILLEMKQKGRYNIKVAEKNEVKIEKGSVENFFKLYETMAKRQKITYRNIAYFQTLLDIGSPKEYVQVFSAKAADGAVLASAIIVFYKDICTYLFGGSSDEQREKMGPYKLHWEIMKEAKKRGCKYYDMFGIAPNDDEKHPWAGVTRFKKQFGGNEFTALGSWDMIFSPVKYQIFKIAELIRRH
ncbi:MAG: peptidoglycan bridge formation glycyltransferase FemA/FemB family protein [Candidatus Berkelbacteria bacterium]|nr:peptidoglycan bridge formation glycyltransferase FemA/FemB family protein [Candidatus Berkelbacteria bacterium]